MIRWPPGPTRLPYAAVFRSVVPAGVRPLTEALPAGTVTVTVPCCPQVGVPVEKYCEIVPAAAPFTVTEMAPVPGPSVQRESCPVVGGGVPPPVPPPAGAGAA